MTLAGRLRRRTTVKLSGNVQRRARRTRACCATAAGAPTKLDAAERRWAGTTRASSRRRRSSSMSPRYAVGIDLGTTHSALAVAAPSTAGARRGRCRSRSSSRAGSVEARPLLPSFLYFAHESEGPQALPWDAERRVRRRRVRARPRRGRARARSSRAPRAGSSTRRSIAARASCRSARPRTSRRSRRSRRRGATSSTSSRRATRASRRRRRGARATRTSSLTVPASFDAAARELTVEAALAAGLETLTLLEEPQAALYAWIAAHGDALAQAGPRRATWSSSSTSAAAPPTSRAIAAVERGRLARARARRGRRPHPARRRQHGPRARAPRRGRSSTAEGKDDRPLAAWRARARVPRAKERLLARRVAAPRRPSPSPSRGVGAPRRRRCAPSSRATRSTRTLVDGFFPAVAGRRAPGRRARAAASRSSACRTRPTRPSRGTSRRSSRARPARWRARGLAGDGARRAPTLLHPTAVLFNGGVMKADAAARPRSSRRSTRGSTPTARPRCACSTGPISISPSRAARAPTASRAAAGPAHPRRHRARLLRRHRERGARGARASSRRSPRCASRRSAWRRAPRPTLPPHELGVVVGEPVRFRFFGSSVRREDQRRRRARATGRTASSRSCAPIEVTLPAEGRREGDVVPVRLRVAASPRSARCCSRPSPLRAAEGGRALGVELSVRGEG